MKRRVSSEECAEGFFDLADGVEGDVVFLAVEALEVVLGDDNVGEAQLLGFGDALLDAVHGAYLARESHYGLLSPSCRDKLRNVQEQLGGTPLPKERRKKTYEEVCQELGWEIGICPHCKSWMIVVETIRPARAPPLSAHVRTASL